MTWWPFGKGAQNRNQQQQVEESMRRISEEGDRRVEVAQAKFNDAAQGAKDAVARHMSETGPLRDALKTLIDRQSAGQFNLHHRTHRP